MRRIAFVAACLLLLSPVAQAQTVYRATGYRIIPTSSVPSSSGCSAGRLCLWADGSNSHLMFYDGSTSTDMSVVIGGGIAAVDAPLAGSGTTGSHLTCTLCATTNGSQTLTNKTISGASNTLSNIAQASVTNLTSDLAAKASTSTSLTAGAGLTGGGDLSAGRTFAVGAGTGITVNADDVAIDTSVVPRLATANTWTASQNVAAYGVTDAATVATNAALGNTFTVTLGGNRTLGNPTNVVAGGTYQWIVTQDGTGSRTLAYASNFKWPGGTAPTLTTTAAAVDVLSCVAKTTSLLLCNSMLDVK